jgi:hypothetical protein
LSHASPSTLKYFPGTAVARIALITAMVFAAGQAVAGGNSGIGRLSFIGEQRIALKYNFQDTAVGGLSGLDYDARRDVWILASDDRSAESPARFYTARLSYDAQAFRAVDLTGVHAFKQAGGNDYPGVYDYLYRGGEIADVEAVRADPRDGSMWYTSEGSRPLGLAPFVKHADNDGAQPAALPQPAMFNIKRGTDTGPRDNLSFEGLSFAPDGNSLWVAMEAPLYQDGKPPTPTQGAYSRITRYARDGRVLGQYAYPIDAIPAVPAAGRAADNGVSEILAESGGRLLVLERSAVQGEDGNYRNYIRLYEADPVGASDVQAQVPLKEGQFVPLSKRLVLNLNTLGLGRLDNLEGMAWGPRLPNGHASLVMVSDDNFNKKQVTQFLAFDVAPSRMPTLDRTAD